MFQAEAKSFSTGHLLAASSRSSWVNRSQYVRCIRVVRERALLGACREAARARDKRIIPAKAVAPFRQGHKTDSNDALAVAEAARRPNIKEAPMKTAEQQGLQAIQRSRELADSASARHCRTTCAASSLSSALRFRRALLH